MIEPDINFKFHEFEYSEDKKVLIIEIPAEYKIPTRFAGETYPKYQKHKGKGSY